MVAVVGDFLFRHFAGLDHACAFGNHDPATIDLDVNHTLGISDVFGALRCLSFAHLGEIFAWKKGGGLGCGLRR